MTRGPAAPLPDPGGFRCLVCQAYVQGTASGHCPRCGFVPPSAPEVPATKTRNPAVLVTVLVILAGVIVGMAVR